MSSKSVIWLGMIIGSSIGGVLPIIWGGNLMSFSSVILTAVGGITGIWLGYKISHF